MSAPTLPSLKGLSILVVEDDYYQATATQEACEAAGATIAGPFGNATAAMLELDRASPIDCAVIDVNLGAGPEFDLARELKIRGIPTVLVSGYQAESMPADLDGLSYLEKPAERASLVSAIRNAASAGKPAS